MSHCRCLFQRNLLIKASSTLSSLKIAGGYPLRPIQLRALSTTKQRLQTNNKGSDPTQHDAPQFDDGSSSSGSDSETGRGGTTEDEEHEHNIRRRILDASLVHVQVHGWSKQALEAGAESEGLPPIARGMFPRGGAELVHHFYAKSNAELANILKQKVEQQEKEGSPKPPITPFVREAMEMRLRMIEPYLDTWSQAMAIQALPVNAVESWTNLLNLADEIWYYAGDRSIDFNWYTKRVTLAAVYKSSEIYMLQDKSPDLADTLNFMDRRLEDLKKFGMCKQKVDQNMSVLKEGLEASVTLGRNILGMNSRNR